MHYTLPFASPTISHRTPLGPSCDRLAGMPARGSDVTFGPVLLTFHVYLRFVLSAGGTIVHPDFSSGLIGARAVPVPFWLECIYTLSP